jgi:hypothetical protein
MAVGLLYLNLSLLILGIEGAAQGAWIGVWFAAGIAQLAAGAAMKSAVPIGFGVTALAVNLFTRYYEHFWDRLAKGLFFLLGGVLLFGLGFACERLARRAGYGSARPSTGSGRADGGGPERADGVEGQP